MAFASSRGWHRMAVAIEDAGLRIHPTIFAWTFGSGFPKATRVGNSAVFQSHRYGGQALKPAVEPIIVFQKPYEGKPVDSIIATGAGALWIDGGRIGTADDMNPRDFDDSRRTAPKLSGTYRTEGAATRNRSGIVPNGRWPANFILSHAPDCVENECVEECPVRRLGEQSGESVSSDKPRNNGEYQSVAKGRELPHVTFGHTDFGTAARFFFNSQYEQIDLADPVIYQAKAGRRERDAGLDGMPAHQKVFNGKSDHSAGLAPSSVEDKFTTSPARNFHPTCKPITLIRHLATLLLPPAEYAPRRIMIPFSGSGSECIGAMWAGWEEVVGIEREADYVEIARKRIEYWAKREQSKPVEPGLPLLEMLEDKQNGADG